MTTTFRNGFEWGQVGWSRAGVPQRPLCCYCAGLIARNANAFTLYRKDGGSARFCERCVERWIEITPHPTRLLK